MMLDEMAIPKAYIINAYRKPLSEISASCSIPAFFSFVTRDRSWVERSYYESGVYQLGAEIQQGQKRNDINI